MKLKNKSQMLVSKIGQFIAFERGGFNIGNLNGAAVGLYERTYGMQ